MNDKQLRDLDIQLRNEPDNEYFEYLDDLRELGVTNMYGATPYLVEMFGIEQIVAKKILLTWMDTFSQRHAKSN